MRTQTVCVGSILVAAFAASVAPAAAAVNLVSNGGFEMTSVAGGGQLGYNITASDWSTLGPGHSYFMLFPSGSADTTGVTSTYGNLKLWGPGDGSANGLPASSPDGGNFVGSDPDFLNTALTQTVTGLTVGDKYTLSFYWAAAQQYDRSGPVSAGWDVSLGGVTQSTGDAAIASHGFSGWALETFSYTATSTTEVLSFLATGSGGRAPAVCSSGWRVARRPAGSRGVDLGDDAAWLRRARVRRLPRPA